MTRAALSDAFIPHGTFKVGDRVRVVYEEDKPLATVIDVWPDKYEGDVVKVRFDVDNGRAEGTYAHQGSVEPAPPTCAGCKREIDPDVCWCGEYADHRHPNAMNAGHAAIPMGCVCSTAEHARDLAREELDDLLELAHT